MAVVEKVLASFLLPEAMDLLDQAALKLLPPALGLQASAGNFALAIGLAGSQETVDRQLRDLEALVSVGGGSPSTFREMDAKKVWAAITNVLEMAPPDPTRVVCKVAVPIGRIAGLMTSARVRAAEQDLAATMIAHAGSGVLRAALSPAPASPDGLSGTVSAVEALRKEAVALGGSLVIQEAPPGFKARVDAWGRPGSGFATMRRIKAEFDPRGLCSPGRFLSGI